MAIVTGAQTSDKVRERVEKGNAQVGVYWRGVIQGSEKGGLGRNAGNRWNQELDYLILK